jgi:hypothetical protein
MEAVLDSRLRRASQTPNLRSRLAELHLHRAGAHMPLLTLLQIGFVGKDYEELVFVLLTMIFSFAVMVAFGAWWQR